MRMDFLEPDLTRQQNHGLRVAPPRPTDYVLGGVSPVPRETLGAGRDWRDTVPVHETQLRYGLETMACVSFATTSAIENLMLATFQREVNYSDRFLAMMSETTHQGNFLTKVIDTARKVGLVTEDEWGWNETITDWNTYYTPPPIPVRDKAKDFVDNYELMYEWAHPNWGEVDLDEALQFSPVVVGMQYAQESWKDDQGVYHYNWAGNRNDTNHAVVYLHKDDDGYRYIQDTYGSPIKKLATNYPLVYGIRISLTERKPMPIKLLELPNDCLVFSAWKHGTTALHIKGVMIIDDLAKLQSQWAFRNEVEGMFTGGPVRTIPASEFDKFPKQDLKGNPL